jgi:hypothetical protein
MCTPLNVCMSRSVMMQDQQAQWPKYRNAGLFARPPVCNPAPYPMHQALPLSTTPHLCNPAEEASWPAAQAPGYHTHCPTPACQETEVQTINQ